MTEKPRIGILTAGGDCPGLNAGIRAVTKTALSEGYEVLGFHDGYRGIIEGDYEVLTMITSSGIIDKGGTILGTRGSGPSEVAGEFDRIARVFEDLKIEALVVIGGNTSLTTASRLFDKGLPIIGIPKTIDNDVAETDFTIGFQTAVQIATDALDRLRSTAESHNRVMILEVMGRDTGWIATYAGMANGADAILIPEVPVDLDKLCSMLVKRSRSGKRFSVVVVAEGIELPGIPPEKHRSVVGVSLLLEEIISERAGLESRTTILGHVQRGGTPVATDRNLATAMGVKAVEMIREKRYGGMTALRGSQIAYVPLADVADKIKRVDLRAYEIAKKFFG